MICDCGIMSSYSSFGGDLELCPDTCLSDPAFDMSVLGQHSAIGDSKIEAYSSMRLVDWCWGQKRGAGRCAIEVV